MSADLHIREYGSGPSVLLLHAFPCDGTMWEPQAQALAAAGRHVLVPDLPGFGRSTLPVTTPSLELIAGTLLAELRGRGIDTCVVGGISLGGYLAMAMADLEPAVLSGVALCDTKATADGDVARQNRERLALLCEESPGETSRILEQSVLPGLLGTTTRELRPAVVERVRGWLAAAPAETVAWYQRAMGARPDSRGVLSRLAVPSVVIWGVEDALSPREEQDLMMDELADGDFVPIEGAGHLSNVERPLAVTEALVDFSERLR